ncbi:eukaryotic translation initiation factor 4E-binding protein Mextli isoform X1 [Leguminivora glycinivorella]|uniref:eukaryotic translation initiation factor 4E-binding protein Mextli isoform X1 n=2 Tax=Leguminivora glycinivorella TaxID=1035111 RepID=UPI00200CFCF9|nr:eukaryotic translation initiation factor 4E-binding protein Mextli isoform X1 [Leguminivora glycinivorella]
MDDTMSTVTKMTRTVKKLEVPRPLKSTTSSAHNRNSVLDVKINSVDDLIVLTEAVAYEMMQGNYDRALQSNVSTMYSNLKLYGAQLEALYKDFLDRYFVVFRNGSQDERLDKKTRLHLLELIELRAKHWQTSDYMSQYYRHRGTHAEPLLVPTMEGAGGSVSPTLATPPEPPALLQPGEVIKPSGKFPKPTKIPGKNYSKDEVVIRNADSGKVMGIKGRRVHMIEELSDTIISFQRVSPGAKERLVQITGPNEENVNHAKHLIGDTIRRNASPVRLEGALEPGAAADDNGEEADDEPRAREKSPHNNRALLHSFSTNDAALGEYKYTVTFGPHSIKITGQNLDLVKTAKLVLDEYFESAGALEAWGAGSGDFFTLSQRPQAALLLRTDPELNGDHDDDVFAPAQPTSQDEAAADDAVPRRPRFSRAASTDKNQGPGGSTAAPGSRQTYTYETLVQYADSPLSKLPPAGLALFPPELARKSCLEFDSASYLKKVRAAAGTTVAAMDAPDSPEPE